MTTVTYAELQATIDDATRRLRAFLDTDPWLLADELRDALFLLNEEPTDEQRTILSHFGGV